MTFSSLKIQFCPNALCSYFQQRGGANVRLHGRKAQRYRCLGCGKTWVAHRHSIRFGLRVPAHKWQRALPLFEQAESVRFIARAVGVSPTTVQRWKTHFDI